ncbi:hypothetical protein, partial [Shigella boydii]|uniref:hypothetical protein n=1 Tax=Shigella boydii TaxID=621 RepID=UPI001C0A7A48
SRLAWSVAPCRLLVRRIHHYQPVAYPPSGFGITYRFGYHGLPGVWHLAVCLCDESTTINQWRIRLPDSAS